MSFAGWYFVALQPDEAFASRVMAWKQRTRELVGNQLYLDDPPHLTLYVAYFAAGTRLGEVVGRVAGRVAVPAVSVAGWHVFEADQLTGNHTLVCEVSADAGRVLGEIQEEVIAAAAPLRGRAETRSRYDEVWPRLLEPQRANVQKYGFPFVGAAWHPHLTIASVRPQDWEVVWSALAGDPPSASVGFPHLALYALKGSRPALTARFALHQISHRETDHPEP